MHFNLASSTVWSTTFLCVYWPCFLLPFSLSSFSVPLSLFFVLKPPHLNSCQLTARPTTNCSFCPPLPSATPLLLLQPLLPPPTQPSFFPIHCPQFGHHPQIKNATKTQHWHLFGPPDFAIICLSSTSSSSFFSLLPPLSCCSNPLLLLLSSLHSLRPSCLSFLHGTVAFLWTSLPVACGHVPTPLHCPPLRSVSFPLSPVPYPPLAPCPAAPPAVSKERYATLPLYSFRYVIILSSPFLLLLLTGKVGMSCLMLLALFFNHWWLVIRLQGYEGWGVSVCFGVCMTCFGCCGFVWGK